MKQFHSKLDKLYEGLHLKKMYIPETQKPDFKSNENPFTLNSILRRVYDSIEQTLKAGRNEDFSDKEKLDDYEKQFGKEECSNQLMVQKDIDVDKVYL